MTDLAGLELRDVDLLLHATGRLLKADAHVVAQIGPAAAAAPLAAVLLEGLLEDAAENAAAPPAAAEDLAENLEGIMRASAAEAAHAPAPAKKPDGRSGRRRFACPGLLRTS